MKLFLDHIDRIGFGIRSKIVRDAANSILAQNYTSLYNNNKEPPRVRIYWPKQYLEKSPYIKIKAKPIETARKKA